MATQQVPITSPIKGIVRAVPREGQPPETCWDAVNCVPYDKYGRKRLAQRPGLVKQWTNQLESSYVQGLLEAPSIIYPPNGMMGVLGSITSLIPGPFVLPFPAPAKVGPYTHVYPSYALGTPYEWQFTVTWTVTVTPVDPLMDWAGAATTNVAVYWPIGSGAANSLILWITCTTILQSAGGPPVAGIGLSAYHGNPTAADNIDADFGTPPSAWGVARPLSPSTVPQVNFNPADGAQTYTVTADCLIIIGPGNVLTITMTNGDPDQFTGTGTTGITAVEYPELAIQYAHNYQLLISNATVSSTLAITD
jgi:hypothetical protein